MPFNLSPCVQIEYEFRSVAFEEKEKLVYLARRKTFRNKNKKLNPQRNAGPNQTSVPLSNIWQIRTKWNNTVAKWDNTVAKWNNTVAKWDNTVAKWDNTVANEVWNTANSLLVRDVFTAVPLAVVVA